MSHTAVVTPPTLVRLKKETYIYRSSLTSVLIKEEQGNEYMMMESITLHIWFQLCAH